MTDLPIMCDLTALTDADRKAMMSESRIIFSEVAEVKALPTGYSFKFLNVDSNRIAQIAKFIALDRLCCAFIRHEIILPVGSLDIWINFTASQDIKSFLENDISQLLGEKANIISMFKQALKQQT